MIHKTRPPHVENMCCPNVSYTVSSLFAYDFFDLFLIFTLNGTDLKHNIMAPHFY